MANDRIRLVCKTCQESMSLFHYYPDPDAVCWSWGPEQVEAFVREHLYCRGYGPDLEDDPGFSLETSRMQLARLDAGDGPARAPYTTAGYAGQEIAEAPGA